MIHITIRLAALGNWARWDSSFAFGCGEWYVNGHGGVVRMQARKGRLNLVLLKGEVAHLGAFGGAHPRASRDPPSAVRGGGEK